MTRPGIEPRSPGPLANTLNIKRPKYIYIYIYIYIYERESERQYGDVGEKIEVEDNRCRYVTDRNTYFFENFEILKFRIGRWS